MEDRQKKSIFPNENPKIFNINRRDNVSEKLEFDTFDKSLQKLLDKIQWKPDRNKKPKAKKRQQKSISQKNILGQNNLKLDDIGMMEEEDEEILYGPPNYFNSKKIINGSFITTFDGNHNNLYFPVCSWSICELARISEFWEVKAKIPFTIIIDNKKQIKSLSNNQNGIIEVSNIQNLEMLENELKDVQESILEINPKNREEPIFILKAFNKGDNYNTSILYQKASKILCEVGTIMNLFDFIVIQKLVGYATLRSAKNTQPYIFRCILYDNNSIELYCLKWKKHYLSKFSNKTKGFILKSKYSEDKRFLDFFHKIYSNIEIEESESILLVELMIIYCLNTNNWQNLNIKKIPIEYYPNLVKSCKDIFTIIQKYCFKKQNKNITRIVLDFIQDAPDDWFFLQIKDLKTEETKDDKDKFILKSRQTMGLGSINQCEAFFCKKNYENEIAVMQKAMRYKEILNKSMNKFGTHLTKQSLIINYNDELNDLTGSIYTSGSKVEIKIQNNQHLFHILQPFLKLNLRQNSLEFTKSENIVPKKPKLNLTLMHTCDLCHRILELYENKLKIIIDNNQILLSKLSELAKKSIDKFDFFDYCELICILKINIPEKKSNNFIGIKSNSVVPIKKSSNGYFFGYKAIDDSLEISDKNLHTKDIKAKVKESQNNKNFVQYNKSNILNIIDNLTMDIKSKKIDNLLRSKRSSLRFNSIITKDWKKVY